MSKKKNKKGVCSPKFQYGVTLANFRLSVKEYVIAKMCREATTKAKIVGLAQFYTGIVQGYEDWYHFMNITDEQFLEVYKELEPDTLKKEAQDVLDKTLKPKKKTGIIFPTGVGSLEVKAAKEIFDKHLIKGGGRQ